MGSDSSMDRSSDSASCRGRTGAEARAQGAEGEEAEAEAEAVFSRSGKTKSNRQIHI